MKKSYLTTAFLVAAVVALAGCSDKQESTPAATTANTSSAATSATTAAPSETTPEQTSADIAAETEPTTAPEETNAPEKSDCPYDFDFDVTRLDGKTLKFSEADRWDEYTFSYDDAAVYRFTSGETYDSVSNPEMFDVPNFVFDGDMYSIIPEWHEAHVGDTFCDGALTVSKVETAFQYSYDTEANELQYTEIAANNITLDGEVTLKGRCVCASADDGYISTGDVTFVPFVDQITDFPMLSPYVGITSWADDKSDAWALDSLSQNIGSINDNDLLSEYLETGDTRNLEVTLTDIVLTFNDQRGFIMRCTVKSVSEYEF